MSGDTNEVNEVPAAASPARRRFIVAAATLAAAVASGAFWVIWRTADKESWIEATLRKNLPNITLDAESLTRFVREFARRREFDDRRTSLAVQMDQALPLIARNVAKAERRIERMERLVVSEYLC